MAAVVVGVPVQPHAIGVVVYDSHGENLCGGVAVVELVHDVNQLFSVHFVPF